ncbi:high-affinity choline transporter 1-like isoform X1 [Macrobrachium rosenbergii]|uniref:high-affinity choline transporter 1-like isoform X1 n=1 Tax=Macrobrachium rosenbergii TaxID=79674 RepID=UPI0034D71CFD
MTTTETPLNSTDLTESDEGPGVNVAGLVAIIVFYFLILVVGLWAAWKKNRNSDSLEGQGDEVMLAGRDIGLFLGCLTMTATWVGGGYINGSAEAVFADGLVWCQAPFGYSLSLVLGGAFFARKMRERRYITMLDPLQERFGRRWGAMLYLPALAGETLWSASILGALGSTIAVILDLGNDISIILSAVIAVVYTMFGGLYSVAYTDVIQLFCIIFGLCLAIPFAMHHEAVGSLSLNETDWLGAISPDTPWVWAQWTDYYILMFFGGIPWQVYFQRVLSARTSKQAEILSYFGAAGCFLLSIPCCVMGAIAKATDWSKTSYKNDLTAYDQRKLVLPVVIQYLTPKWVAFFGLGAVSAAVMSSADSSVLSASSMFANNVYRNVIRQQASDRELIWVMRASIVVVAVVATVTAIFGKSIYALFYLCGDFVYVMLFPQLTMAVHFPDYVNTYGSIVGYVLGFLFRILGGEDVLYIPVVIEYPYYIDGVQYFPFRTLSMIITLVALILFSWATQKLYDLGYFKDVLNVFGNKDIAVISADAIRAPSHPGGLDNPALDLHVNGKKHEPPAELYKEAREMAHF